MSTPAKSALRKAGLFYFVWVMFSYCTGGPFGLEDMVTTSGPGMTLIFLLVIPFFWCIPVSLVSAELTTAMPVEGGFYRWVRAGFGDFWGFLAGWWNWCASFLLGSVYAVQFADYLGFYFPDLIGWRHYIVSLAIVAVITYINVRGIQMVGKFATTLELFILLPVLVLVVIALAKWHHNPFVPVCPAASADVSVFGVGLALGLWLYSGYEQCSTVAEEVDNPRRSYPLALALVVPMSIAAYFLPTLAVAGGAGQLGELAHRIFSHRRPTHRRPLARRLDVRGRHDHLGRPAQRHHPGVHAHALCHGGRRLPAARAHRHNTRATGRRGSQSSLPPPCMACWRCIRWYSSSASTTGCASRQR